jgi:GTP 3',8-cyclase
LKRFSRGIRAAPRAAGLTPLKINCVLLRGFNDDQIEGFARFAREEDVVVRFIEFMPLEEGRLWTPEIVVPLAKLSTASAASAAGRTAAARGQRDRAPLHFADGVGEIGIIAPGQPGLLRRMQPGAAHLRRQDSHLPVLAGRARPLWPPARRRQR